MRVRDRPRVRSAHTVCELDAADLGAIHTAPEWGWIGREEVVYVKVRPCRWAECGGSVRSFSGETRCLLCCRVPGEESAPALKVNGGGRVDRAQRQGRSRGDAHPETPSLRAPDLLLPFERRSCAVPKNSSPIPEQHGTA